MAARSDDQVSAIHTGLEDSLGPSRAHDEPVFARHDNTPPALEAWISNLEQVLQVSAIATSGHPRDRLRSRLQKARRQRQAPKDRHSDISTAPANLECHRFQWRVLQIVAHARALAVTRAQAARVGRSLPDEPSSDEFGFQLNRLLNEARAGIKRAGRNVEARRGVWRRIDAEARRATKKERRSATPQRRPFPKHSPEKSSRPARRTRPRTGQGGRRRS